MVRLNQGLHGKQQEKHCGCAESDERIPIIHPGLNLLLLENQHPAKTVAVRHPFLVVVHEDLLQQRPWPDSVF